MRSRLLAFILAVAAIACRDVTGPGTRHAASIYGMQTPTHATYGDTIWISFYIGAPSCDTGLVVSSERTATGVRFSASSVITTTGACPNVPVALSIAPLPYVYAATPPHQVPFVARFAQPGGADSVRTIQQ